ncbi:MAG: DUF2142 domain-containing protein [Ruminococcus sp.]|nr:DUF2142 domain-containing protein [Ruminococcus sp.]
MLNKIKKILTNPVYIVIVIFMLVIVFKSVTIVKAVNAVYSEDVNLDNITVRGYTYENYTLTPINDAPQINIPCSKETVNLITINFAEPVYTGGDAKIYYSVDEDQGLSEAKSIYVPVPVDATQIFVELPYEAVYTRVRFDMSSVFVLGSIEWHRGGLNNIIQINYGLIIVSIILAIIILMVYFTFRKQIDGVILRIISKYRNESVFVLESSYKVTLSKLYLILSISFGIMIIFLCPPNSMPDEQVHFNVAVSISRGNFFGKHDENGRLGYLNFYDEVELLPVYRKSVYPETFTYSDAQYYYNKKQPLNPTFNPIGLSNPVGYLVSGLGMSIAQTLLRKVPSAYTLMIIGRCSNLLFAAVVMSYSIRKSRVLNNTMFLLGLMPMTLYQCSSISYDAITFSAVYLLFAVSNNIFFSKENYIITVKDICLVCIASFMLFGSKGGVFATFTLVLLAIEIKKFGNKKRYFFCIGLIVFTAIIAYIVPRLIIHSLTIESGYIDDIRISQQQEYLMSNLNQIPIIIFETFKKYGSKYWEEYIGCLGYFDVHIPYPYLVAYTIALIISCLIEVCMVKNMKLNFRMLSLIASIISFMGIVFSMYLSYAAIKDRVGGVLAIGIQGRYFIPLTLFVIIFFANPLLCKFKYTPNIMQFDECLVKIGGITSCLITVFSLFVVYWL